MSRSRRGVIRGLHLRIGRGREQAGALLLRPRCSTSSSTSGPARPTYGEWLSFVLDGEQQNSVYIPAGCAHGFQALTEPADTAYRIDRRHDPREDLTIAHDDPRLAIPWPLPAAPCRQPTPLRHRFPAAESSTGSRCARRIGRVPGWAAGGADGAR